MGTHERERARAREGEEGERKREGNANNKDVSAWEDGFGLKFNQF